MDNKEVCLINMPFSSLERPSLALGLIEQYIEQQNHSVEVIYGSLEFATKIDIPNYYLIEKTNHEDMIGEWIFSRIAFPSMAHDDKSFFSLFPNLPEVIQNKLFLFREAAEKFIVNLATKILSKEPKIVGCSSTFQQNCASLALLRILKENNPSLITMMGGANCEGIMGKTIIHNFPWIDYIFSGESDDTIGIFIDNLLLHKSHELELPKGVFDKGTQFSEENIAQKRGVVTDMTKVTSPNYDSYFNALNRLQLKDQISPGLIVETSRGCWWGAKNPCTFCGLNGNGITYRAKAPDTVFNEWKNLSTKYGIKKFEVVDNILPLDYFKTLLPKLAELPEKYSIFYETKANLSKQQVNQLNEAGIKWIQPGIEGLHDDFLKLIQKGVTAMQNIALLKWCREKGIRVSWNLLAGVPNEKEIWFLETAKILPLISHLQPPQQHMIKVRYQRFSSYFDNAKKYNLKLSPAKNYRYLYPLSNMDLFNIAYFFEDTEKQKKEDTENQAVHKENGYAIIQSKIEEWFRYFWTYKTPPLLCMTDHGDYIHILDTRRIAPELSFKLYGISMEVYRVCNEPKPLKKIIEDLSTTKRINEKSIINALNDLIERKLVLFISNKYLSLALEGEIPELASPLEYPGGYLNFLDPHKNKYKHTDLFLSRGTTYPSI